MEYIKCTELAEVVSGQLQAKCSHGISTPKEVRLEYGVPQGSVLGPKEYSMYTLKVGAIFQKHGMQYMTYTENTQGYIAIKSREDWLTSTSTMKAFVSEVNDWMSIHFLKLNNVKIRVCYLQTSASKSLTPELHHLFWRHHSHTSQQCGGHSGQFSDDGQGS